MQIYFDQIIKNINSDTYRYIGSGSGRAVYDLGNGYVAKYAKNKKGFAQNEVEHHISASMNSDVLAKAVGISDDSRLLIMEKADKIKHISDVWRYFEVDNNRELCKIKDIKKLINKFEILKGDLYRASNWGKIDGRCVIVDYGFTRIVRNKYYWHF